MSKNIGKSLVFRALLLVFLLFAFLSASAQSLETILTNGPASNRFNLVFLSEGYTSGQLIQFRTDATNAARALLSRKPFSEYSNFFNVYAISVASAQAGSDHPDWPSYRDTYFNSVYQGPLITIPPNGLDTNYGHGQGKVDALLQSYVPECRAAILLVNDLTPGGSDGGGAAAIVYRGAGMMDYLAHELGHVMGNLGDEYTNSNPGYPDTEEPNTARGTNLIKWPAWIAASTPVPTPASAEFANTVGLFEGAHYHVSGWYRPKFDCTMNHPTFPEYCEVCQEALVLSLYHWVRPVDARSPGGASLVVELAPRTFALSLVEPSTHSLLLQWYTNGMPVPGATNATFTLFPQALGSGLHRLEAAVLDSTVLVRSDPAQGLSQVVSWQLQVTLPELRLDSPLLLPDGAFAFRVSGTAPQGFAIESRSGTLAWRRISTNGLVGGEFWLTNSAPLESTAALFRAVSPP